jgi:hypothetical protein
MCRRLPARRGRAAVGCSSARHRWQGSKSSID